MFKEKLQKYIFEGNKQDTLGERNNILVAFDINGCPDHIKCAKDASATVHQRAHKVWANKEFKWCI